MSLITKPRLVEGLDCMHWCKTIAQHDTYFYKDEDTFLTSAHPTPAVVTVIAAACSTRSSTKTYHFTISFICNQSPNLIKLLTKYGNTVFYYWIRTTA